MKRQMVMVLIASTLISGTAWAQEPTAREMLYGKQETTEERDARRGWREAHPKLKAAGWTMVILGGLAAIPWGTAVHLGDQDYCVKTSGTGAYVDVQEGGCGFDPTQVKVSAVIVGTGFMLVQIGGRHVAIKPTVTAQVKAASVQVTW